MRKKPVRQSQRPTSGATSRIYSRENVGRYAERARQRRRGKIIRRGLLCTFLAILLTGVAVAGLWFQSVVSRLNNGEVITNDLLITLVDSDVARDPFYMLLLGTDGRPGETSYRSDTIILARIDPVEKEVTLISIPRDTKVEYNGSTMKINAVHTYAGAVGMVEAVNELCGVEISHYAEVSFNGLVALANTLLNKVDAANIVPIINSVSDMVVTDLSIQDIVSLANAMRGMDTDGIWSANVPSTTAMIDGVSYVIADEDERDELLEHVDHALQG